MRLAQHAPPRHDTPGVEPTNPNDGRRKQSAPSRHAPNHIFQKKYAYADDGQLARSKQGATEGVGLLRPNHTDARMMIEKVPKRPDGSCIGDSIRVYKKNAIALRVTDTHVIAGAETHIAGTTDKEYRRKRVAHERTRIIVGAIVHNNNLVRDATQGTLQ